MILPKLINIFAFTFQEEKINRIFRPEIGKVDLNLPPVKLKQSYRISQHNILLKMKFLSV